MPAPPSSVSPPGVSSPGAASAGSADATEATRRAAVQQRDRLADGVFWYGVTTTGIYCRPACPSRRAKDSHVRLFDTPAAARAAGFRACKRCRPDDAVPLPSGRDPAGD